MVASASPTHCVSLNDFIDISPLRCHGARSGIRNVYFATKNDDGVDVWVAKVKLGGKLYTLPGSRSTQPRESARHVARWYCERFGPDWARLARSNARRRNPWKVWYSARYAGWLARVWIRGRPVELQRLTRRVPARPWKRPVLLVFPSAAQARAAIRPWVERQYRCDSRSVVYIATAA